MLTSSNLDTVSGGRPRIMAMTRPPRAEMTRSQRRHANQHKLDRQIRKALAAASKKDKQAAYIRYLRNELYAARAHTWGLAKVIERLKDGSYDGPDGYRTPRPPWTAGELERALLAIIDRAGPIDRSGVARCAEILAIASRAPRSR